jgi:hypothetical protein
VCDTRSRDLADYQETIQSFDVPAVSERFAMLRSLANIFIVRPETIKSYLSESYLARIDPKLLKTFLMQRSDYSDLSRSFWNDVSLRRFFFACKRLTTECRCAVRRLQTHSVYSGGRDALRRRRAREATFISRVELLQP